MNLPLGYRFASVYAGIRKIERDDLALVVSEPPANAAAVFTQNRVVAAPVKLARAHLKKSGGIVQALLINAGNANCATRTGSAVAAECCEALAKSLETEAKFILPASTGVIGVELEAAKIVQAIPQLVESLKPDRFDAAAHAILTTDLKPKTAAREITLSGGMVRIAGFTKGSGMIQPRLATTLGFILTDAALTVRQTREILTTAAERSYNRISVDGDTSTNDTLVLLANGASGVSSSKKERAIVEEAIGEVAQDLAVQIVRDGEGARKLIEITVAGASNDRAAERIARSIANSPLVKTAIAGSDPNWGRILSAAGNSGANFNPRKVDIEVQGVEVCKAGVAADFDERGLKQALDSTDCRIHFVIRGKKHGKARFWTCDLTEKYIEINASYRT